MALLNDEHKISRFHHEFAFLSNFWFSSFEWNGSSWPTVEHAYQAAKCLSIDEANIIQSAPYPGMTKRLGRATILRDDWEQIKMQIMRICVYHKFNQSNDLTNRLLGTENKVIIEGNFHHDNFWGRCPPDNNDGLNHLGLILMEYRQQLQTLGDIIEPDNIELEFQQLGISPRFAEKLEELEGSYD